MFEREAAKTQSIYRVPYNLQRKQKRISGVLDLLILIYSELTEHFCPTVHLLKKYNCREVYEIDHGNVSFWLFFLADVLNGYSFHHMVLTL